MDDQGSPYRRCLYSTFRLRLRNGTSEVQQIMPDSGTFVNACEQAGKQLCLGSLIDQRAAYDYLN